MSFWLLGLFLQALNALHGLGHSMKVVLGLVDHLGGRQDGTLLHGEVDGGRRGGGRGRRHGRGSLREHGAPDEHRGH